MNWDSFLNNVLVPIVTFTAYLIVITDRMKEAPKTTAERDARRGAWVLWAVSAAIVMVFAILWHFDPAYFPQHLGSPDFILTVVFCIWMTAAGIGLWQKRRWGIYLCLVIIPALVYYLGRLMEIRVDRLIAIFLVVIVATVFTNDLRGLLKAWR